MRSLWALLLLPLVVGGLAWPIPFGSRSPAPTAAAKAGSRDPAGSQPFVLSNYVWMDERNMAKIGEANSTVQLFCHHLESVLRNAGVSHRLVGWGSKIAFTGYKEKIAEAHQLAKSLPPDTILAMVDAFDVLVQESLNISAVAHTLRTKYPRQMVFAAEGKCYPLSRRRYANGKACDDYPKSPLGEYSRYLNGGSWIGFASDVAEVTKMFLDQLKGWDKNLFHPTAFRRVVTKLPTILNAAAQDQYGMAVMYLYARERRVSVDIESDIFVCDSGFIEMRGSWRRMKVDVTGFLRDTLTDRIPPIIHFNAGKNKFKDAVFRMPWVTQRARYPSIGDKSMVTTSVDNPNGGTVLFRDICSDRWAEHVKAAAWSPKRRGV